MARGLCGVLRPFGAVVFTFDRPGRGELVLEDLEQAHGRIAMWVEANRNAIEVVKPLELALPDNDERRSDSGHGGGNRQRDERGRKGVEGKRVGNGCESVRTEYPARDISILDLLPPGVSKGWALERLAARLGVDRKETMAIGDNWNDVDMLEWAGQGIVMANAAEELRTLAKTRGWKQAPSNDEDGVAVVLEAALLRKADGRGKIMKRNDRWHSDARIRAKNAASIVRRSIVGRRWLALPHAARAAERVTLSNGFVAAAAIIMRWSMAACGST